MSGSIISRTLRLGAIGGLRSMSAPAMVSRAIADGRLDNLEGTPFAMLGSRPVPTILRVLQVGELLGDKLPMTPSRTAALSLLGRMASGAIAGTTLFAAEDRSPAVGGIIGAGAAVAAAFAGEQLRALVGEKTGVPDPVVALVEDGVVLLGGPRLLR
ncbi:MAG TPA: DUF4126 family protein [Rubrobacteraceae bacterium]|nr:DUF4126 family protein [Rubrobacteraceae bacterium]